MMAMEMPFFPCNVKRKPIPEPPPISRATFPERMSTLNGDSNALETFLRLPGEKKNKKNRRNLKDSVIRKRGKGPFSVISSMLSPLPCLASSPLLSQSEMPRTFAVHGR
ncbi:hypothetical protein HPP92_003759 [Vanilla planifolia]|uniref:Uncharacterized protein n=1 Tax=Vanilla planifolia TaxID=51239 RepID=A0A835SH26_VANPL|nr:hypothetical protein HPP92_003759 [Vanilla planifolia]